MPYPSQHHPILSLSLAEPAISAPEAPRPPVTLPFSICLHHRIENRKAQWKCIWNVCAQALTATHPLYKDSVSAHTHTHSRLYMVHVKWISGLYNLIRTQPTEWGENWQERALYIGLAGGLEYLLPGKLYSRPRAKLG